MELVGLDARQGSCNTSPLRPVPVPGGDGKAAVALVTDEMFNSARGAEDVAEQLKAEGVAQDLSGGDAKEEQLKEDGVEQLAAEGFGPRAAPHQATWPPAGQSAPPSLLKSRAAALHELESVWDVEGRRGSQVWRRRC